MYQSKLIKYFNGDYNQTKIEKIGINDYKITRIDPQPYPNKPSKSKEKVKILLFERYSAGILNEFE